MSEKIEKNQREKKKMKKEMKLKKKERERVIWPRGEKAFTKMDLCTYVQWRIFGL